MCRDVIFKDDEEQACQASSEEPAFSEEPAQQVPSNERTVSSGFSMIGQKLISGIATSICKRAKRCFTRTRSSETEIEMANV